MKLGAQHFPLPCSLQLLVRESHDSKAPVDQRDLMSLEDLLGYLRHPHDLDLSPYADLLSQTDEMGDPTLPSREQTATLRWIGDAMHQFEQRFPLEEPLASQLRRLKPLAAAIALLEPDFQQPGAHPLHRLLDAIQQRAVGWQSRLGRVGTVLERQVTSAVEQALQWFDDDNTDLAAIGEDFLAAAERDQARAQRMSRRVVEAEQGRARTVTARREAAQMINASLGELAVPPEIGRFLQGPWFDSAQLLLLKFGTDSEQWRGMCATTETLLDSVQSLEDATDERRQHIMAIVTQLPGDMRRWLLSLQHDSDAVNDAMALVEYTHLRILRQQPVNRERIKPLAIDAQTELSDALARGLRPIREDQWFGVEVGRNDTLRARLVLKEDETQRLLFTNLAGIQVLDYSYAEFDRLLEQKRITALPRGGAFSLCLAIAAGVDTTEKLEALQARIAGRPVAPEPSEAETEAETETEAVAEQRPEPGPKPPQMPEPAAPGTAADKPAARPNSASPAAETAEQLETAPEEEDLPELSPSWPDETEAGLDELLDARDMRELEALIDEPDTADTQPAAAVDRPEDTADGGGGAYYQASHYQASGLGARVEPSAADDDPSQWLQPPEAQAATRPEPEAEAETATGAETAAASRPDTNAAPETAAEPPRHSTAASAAGSGQAVRPEDIDLPMGAWLGFHDGDTPLMAKLAVHDPEEDLFIFVNRNGIKMRQISGKALARLMSAGMVDILHTASSFRQDVDAARRQLDE